MPLAAVCLQPTPQEDMVVELMGCSSASMPARFSGIKCHGRTRPVSASRAWKYGGKVGGIAVSPISPGLQMRNRDSATRPLDMQRCGFLAGTRLLDAGRASGM